MLNMKIDITPVSVWTASGVVSANKFEVRYVNYKPDGTAQADCHLFANGVEVGSRLVSVTKAQTDAWESDEAFFGVIAENAGLSPV